MARIDREQLGELLSGYIDGELDAREREIIERVLREDESARQLLADLQRAAQAVASLPRHAAPASILGDTQATLERSALLNDFPEPRAHHTRGRSSWTARLAMAAMVGLVVVTGWWFTTEQTRRGAMVGTDFARREGQEAATTSVPASVAVRDALLGEGAAHATVEQQLANGVDPTSFRSQTFAAEPVRLQVTVRDRAQREAVATRIAASLSSQHLADLASASSPRADTTGSMQNFYYRGKAGLNFEAADEDQILVRASPRQIDHLITGLSEPNQPEEAVALVAGPITVQGVENSRGVVQLLGWQQQGGETRSAIKSNERPMFDEKGAEQDADRASASKSAAQDGGMVGGLLKIVGVDPDLLSPGAKSANEPVELSGESTANDASLDARKVAADETFIADSEESAKSHVAEAKKKAAVSAATRASGQPPVPPPLVERRLQAVTESSRESAGKDDRRPAGQEVSEGNITVVVQIIESTRPTQSPQPTKTKPDPAAARKAAD